MRSEAGKIDFSDSCNQISPATIPPQFQIQFYSSDSDDGRNPPSPSRRQNARPVRALIRAAPDNRPEAPRHLRLRQLPRGLHLLALLGPRLQPSAAAAVVPRAPGWPPRLKKIAFFCQLMILLLLYM